MSPNYEHIFSLSFKIYCGLFIETEKRLPDETSERLKANNAWDSIFKWAIGFALETGYLDESSQILLNLASQELGLIEKQPNYVNPYKKDKKPAKRFEEPPAKKKKEKKKLQRGPRMSHGEL